MNKFAYPCDFCKDLCLQINSGIYYNSFECKNCKAEFHFDEIMGIKTKSLELACMIDNRFYLFDIDYSNNRSTLYLVEPVDCYYDDAKYISESVETITEIDSVVNNINPENITEKVKTILLFS